MPATGRRRDNTGVLLLLHFILSQVGLENVPPVTLLTVILQACVFMRVVDLPWATSSSACISFDTVWRKQEWWRIFYGAVEHGDSFHLYYNMVSFTWKGILLEPELGSLGFLYLLGLLTSLTGVTLVVLCYLLGTYVDAGFYYQCAVGFSGVIFALKVINNHYLRGRNPRIFNINLNIPSGYVVWVELILIQLITPNASFVGHLAGILVGLAYAHNIISPLTDFIWQASGRDRTYIRQGTLYTHRYTAAQQDLFSRITSCPVTVVLSGLLIGLYMRSFPHAWARYLHRTCINAHLVMQQKKFDVLVLSSLHCYSVTHLVYIVISLLGVGYYIERRMGWLKFAFLTLLMTVVTNTMYCFVMDSILPHAEELAGLQSFEMPHKCFVGLTGTLIALKVVYSYYHRYADYIFLCFLLPIPKPLGVALEIAILHIVLPNAWVVGNLCGCVTGMAYVFMKWLD
ncbi:rhomboid-related protein 4-like [Ornithodoros turicata]|uniref:rhomboid-related protein 4-like n=1 Tax=Ornithodoros turicata TaxID=34597 RepID=UPI0031397F36